MRYPEFIKNKLKDQEVHIVASGPSLRDFDYFTLVNKNVISVNHSYKKLTQKPIWGVAVDTGFVNNEDPRAPYLINLISKRNEPYPVIDTIWNKTGYDPNPHNGVFTHKCSGAAALCTALHAGASMIYLYGFDCDTTDDLVHATDKEFKHRKQNFIRENEAETKKLRKTNKDKFNNMVKHFDTFPIDNIVNMNIDSKINRFKKVHGY